MNGFGYIHNVGAHLRSQFALIPAVVTAGGGGDGLEQDGAWIEHNASQRWFGSAKLVVVYSTTLTAAKTLTLAANAQDASDSGGTGVADYGTAYASAVVETGVGTFTGSIEIDLNLAASRGFIRIQLTPTLSNTVTDTVALAAALILGGARNLPVTKV